MRRVSKIRKKLSSKGGFTLVEMVVVMGILSFLMVLVFSGFTVARQENYAKYEANNFQAQLRQAFVDAVSTKQGAGGNCVGHSAVIRAIEIKAGSSIDPSDPTLPLSTVVYCENNGSLVNDMTSFDSSSSVGYRQNIEIQASYGNPPSSAAWLTFFYTSPYGKYYFTPNSHWINTGCWKKDNITQEYIPDTVACNTDSVPSSSYGNVNVTFSVSGSGTGSESHQVAISPAGSAELK